MILDLKKFIKEEQPYWDELAGILDKLEKGTGGRLDLTRLKRFHYLYQRTSADLGKLATFSSEPNMRVYLESLVGRAYGEIHEVREKPHRLTPLHWFFNTFPRTFRKHIKAFAVSFLAMFIGFALGGFAILIDPDSKESLIGFSHLKGDPSDRVAKEEGTDKDRLEGKKSSFSSYLMTHNTKVSIFTLALGMTYGIGTIILLFYNGVILGAVALDYIIAGETWFLFGWLLPHGSIEIPAILLAGQAGLALAGALIGWGTPLTLRKRLRQVSNDLVTLIFGVAILLVWAGIVEAFFSQYHQPVIPYTIKVGFGTIELILLALFLSTSGKRKRKEEVRPYKTAKTQV